MEVVSHTHVRIGDITSFADSTNILCTLIIKHLPKVKAGPSETVHKGRCRSISLPFQSIAQIVAFLSLHICNLNLANIYPTFSKMSSNLFKPLRLGNVELQNRIVLAPLTRFRASDEHVPLPFVAEYYAQRGSVPGTLLISEATFIAANAGGARNAPGIWNEDQIQSWKHVTDAVHKKGSFIFMQLWGLGRSANDDVLKEELGPTAGVKSSGDIPIAGKAAPTPLTEAEIEEYNGLFAQAAKNAIAAGFDGVEIHGANGFLVDQLPKTRRTTELTSEVEVWKTEPDSALRLQRLWLMLWVPNALLSD